MKQLLLVATLIASITAFANDPATSTTTTAPGTTMDAGTGKTPTDTSSTTPNEKHAKKAKKHKGTKGEQHPKTTTPGDHNAPPNE